LNRPRLDLDGLTPFEQKSLLLLLQIPRGEVRPYSWLAREIGNPKAARAIGTAMARNPVPLLLPCHRVVPAEGGVGNYAFGSAMKRALLKQEGVPVNELDSLARSGVRYLGCKSTGIYCFPTCRDARRMKPENRMPFSDSGQALESGYRPCQHCRP
jgi:O-6-methylguanine DNA methyltransferase